MQSLRGILNFVRTAELGSFAKAARELGVSPVAVSQNISRLEEALGVRLFARSTRALTLTAEGRAFLEQCSAPLVQLETAFTEAASGAQQAAGRVRATVVSPVAFQYLIPLLPEFYRRYPAVKLEIELSEAASPLIAKKFDVGIRVGALQDAAFVARPLGPMKLLLCGSPAYFAARGVPRSLDEFNAHDWLCLHMLGQEQPVPLILQLRKDNARTLEMRAVPSKFACNDYRSLLRACVDGLGIAQLPQPLALEALREGALQVVLPDYVFAGLQLFIHYPSRKQLPARVRSFVDFCVEHLGGHEDLLADVAPFVATHLDA